MRETVDQAIVNAKNQGLNILRIALAKKDAERFIDELCELMPLTEEQKKTPHEWTYKGITINCFQFEDDGISFIKTKHGDMPARYFDLKTMEEIY